LSRTDSQQLIDIIGNYRQNIPKCWKTIERTDKEDMAVAAYYPIKKTIPWPEHFLMSKWNHPNTTCLEDISPNFGIILCSNCQVSQKLRK